MNHPTPFYLLEIARRVGALLSRKQQRQALLTMGLTFLGNLAELAGLATVVPYVMMIANEQFFQENAYVRALYQFLPVESKGAFFLVTLVGILLLFVVKNAFALAIDYRQARFAYEVATDFSRRQARYFLSRDWLYHLRRSGHEILNEAKTIPYMFGTSVLLRGIGMVGDGLLGVLILAVVMVIDPVMGLAIAAILTPLVIFGYQRIKHHLYELGQQRNTLQPYASSVVFQLNQAYPLIKLYNKEAFFLDTFVHYQRKLNRIQTWLTTYGAFTRKFMEVNALLGILVIATYSMLMGYTGQQLFLFISVYATASYKLIPSLSRFFDSVLAIRSAEYTLDNLEAHLREPADSPSASANEKPLPFRQAIQLRGVTYTYPGQVVRALDGLDLTIPKGRAIGITGASGEGKSTLLYILMQLITPMEGSVLIDREKLQPYHQKAWQEQLGLVWHHNFVLEGTVKENIAFSEKAENVNLDQVQKALQQAGLEQLVNSWPQGIATPISEEGRSLSEGQRQRIALARALYRDAEVLLLDEATNALDSAAEDLVLDTLARLKNAGKTLVMVSHQLNSLRICDDLYRMQDGKLEPLYNPEARKSIGYNEARTTNF